jgi:arylsulfatase A-like enzyme/Flp pilus assembly protein TadD
VNVAALLGGWMLALGAAVPAVRAAEPARPDLVLITVDTLRWDAVGFDGRLPSPTPQLDRLAREGRAFSDVHAHNVVTLPSHTNILTGLYPYQHGVRDNIGFKLSPQVPTIASVARAAGYATGAFVGAYPLDSQFGLAAGFEVYDDFYRKGARPEEYAMPERRGDRVVEAALAWWAKESRRPRFLWVHVYDPHAPYLPPEPFRSRYVKEPYLGEVAAADSFLAPLLDALRGSSARPVFVAMTGDHGEALGDHGELSHGLFTYESTLKVPLVLWGAGVVPGVDSRAARHIDIFPTFMAVAHLDPSGSSLSRYGLSLLEPAPRSPPDSYFEALSTMFNRGWAPLRGMLVGGRKGIALPVPELYDLPSDPREVTNLVDADRPGARAVYARLPRESSWPPPREAPGAEASAELRSLGYLSGEADIKASYGAADDPKALVALDGKLHRIIDFYQSHRLTESVKLAREVVAERPSMAMGHALLAQALLEAGDRDGALAAMQEARRQKAATNGLLVQLGLTLSEAGKPQEAIEVLRPLASRMEPRFSNALGVALSEAGSQTEAEVVLRQALALDPEYAKAWENLALVSLRRGRFGEARERAEKAVQLNPDLPLAWNDLGVALFELGERGPALDAWSKAVALDPHLWDALWNLGVQGAVAGRKEVAREALHRFIAGAPGRYGRDVERARKLLAELGG